MLTEKLGLNSDKSITVLLISTRSDLSGGPRHLVDLLKCLSDSGVKFVVAAPTDGVLAPQLQSHSIRFIDIPRRAFSFQKLLQLAKVIRTEGIALIHSHGRGAGLYSRLLGLLCDRPVCHTFHGIHTDSRLLSRVKLLIDQFFAFTPFTAIFVSDSEKHLALKTKSIHNQRSVIIHNPVDTTIFNDSNRRQRTNDNLVIGTFLRPDLAKGPDYWLKTLSFIDSHDDVKSDLTFKCAGITRAELSRFGHTPDFVDVAGVLAETHTWIASLDVYASFSRTEGLPLGVLEAMASGIPCILSDIPAHRYFEQHKAALLFDANDPSSFVTRVRLLLDAPNTLEELRAAGKRTVERYHSLKQFRNQILRTYIRLTTGKEII